MNGNSACKRRRDANDFPCAGLRWNGSFHTGQNELRAEGRSKDGREVSDTVSFRYESRVWDKAAKLSLRVLRHSAGNVAVEAELLDAEGVRCLDSRLPVRFGFAGDGHLIDNQGTSTGSRLVQLNNGRAEITDSLETAGVVSCGAPGIAPAFLNISGEKTHA